MNSSTSTRTAEEKTFVTHDGVELFYRHWPATTAKQQGAIALFHRGHEHSGRVAHLVDELDMPDYAFFAWDARGHGRSPGERGYSPSLATSVRDIQTFVDHIVSDYNVDMQDIAVIAQSVGAVLVSTWVHDYAPKIRCMVLASPAFKVKLYVPFARLLLKLKFNIKGNFFVNSYVKAKFLTHDPERITSFENDPLITRAISANILTALYDTAERIVADAAAITIPTQLLISGADWVVHHKPQHKFYEQLGSPVKERHILKGFYHDTLGETNRKPVIDKARRFIGEQFSSPLSHVSLLDADKSGFTRYEADTLATPLLPFSFRGLYWALTRFSLKSMGLLSDGVRLGHNTGFDSGSTLDYVYRNQPAGKTSLGKLIDSTYLNSIGWRGIRQRKVNIEELLQLGFHRLNEQGKSIHVMDIAAGHGRYILEALEKSDVKPESILLRDYSDLNVQQGSKLIKDKGMEGLARFEKADAFNPDSYSSIETKPTIGVVSGLYELFTDNSMLKTSLQGLASVIHAGGYLVYTGQPWHPQLEMIARALTSHRQGDAWVMRRRTQAEMDQLVEAAGFTKMEQRIDEYGIFTVSLAIRNNNG